MPITIQTAAHLAAATHIPKHFFATSAQKLYDPIHHPTSTPHAELLQSSFSTQTFQTQNLHSSPNGLVYTALKSYNRHRHLTLRPDDIWFAILSQLNCWLSKAAESVRSKFVAHKGQKILVVKYEAATRYTVDYGDFAQQITRNMEEFIVDPSLREWMMPAFSTTTENDVVVAAVLMMGALRAYFSYKCQTLCGIPSVTLLGERADWAKLLGRLEKLATFGDEPARFGELLRPVCERFVECFDEPAGEKVREFWSHIMSEIHEGSGEKYYSGWITAFCFWDREGNNLHDRAYAGVEAGAAKPAEYGCVTLDDDSEDDGSEDDGSEDDGSEDDGSEDYPPPRKGLEMDGVRYHPIDSTAVPPGFASVPVKLVDDGFDGKVFETSLIAGSVGMQFTTSEERKGARLDSVQPVSGWWMFIDREMERERE